MKKILLVVMLSSGLLPAQAETGSDHAAQMAASLELFKKQVRPALMEHCIKCHGGEKVKSAFNLNTRDQLLAGGDQGGAIVPGHAEQSPLIDYISHLEEPHMPPKKPKLSADTIKAFKAWINTGAAYDQPLVDKGVEVAGPMKVTEEDKAFWSFKPLGQAGPPRVDSPWIRNDIDRFTLVKMQGKSFRPAEAVDRRTLIRRAYFDLLGLPPTPEEVEAFVNDKDPEAYGKLLDHLLESPHFGERWARHWLDPARFAESHGFEHDYDRKFAFHFRDFVIQAFNQDMPYDQFVQWQIAGDELAPDDPQALMATGFLGAGVYPTQITIAEAERIRYDALDDMVATTGTAMLGLTIGCARCHDHKYDPIPTKDYYRFASVFTTTVRSDQDVHFNDPNLKEKTAAWEKKQVALIAERDTFETEQLAARLETWLAANVRGDVVPSPTWALLHIEKPVSQGGATFERQPDGSLLATGKNPDFDRYLMEAEIPVTKVTAIRLEALAHKSMVRGGPGRASNGNIALSSLKVTATFPDGRSTELTLTNPRATFEQGNHLAVRLAIDEDPKSAWALDPQFGKDHAAIFDLSEPLICPPGTTFSFNLHFNNNNRHNIGRIRFAVTDRVPAKLPFTEDSDPTEILLAQLKKHWPGNPKKALSFYKTQDDEWLKRQKAVDDHAGTRPKQRTEKVMICSEGVKPMRHHVADGSIKDFYDKTFLLHRGDVSQKVEPAEPGYLQVLMRGADTPAWQVEKPDGAKQSFRRSGLAEWMTDVDRGGGHLLARVIVNRMWTYHFGRGIVATPNDFGFSGSRPTHPDLLDWLAAELIRNEWRLKPMHKLMMTSGTYLQGQNPEREFAIKDPDNRWLWTREPRRLEAEIIRDHTLAVSGRLDTRMFGAGTLSASHTRRSIYFTVKRSQLIPQLVIFDFPDTLTSQGLRSTTTTPSQALMFMNDPEVRKSALALADRVVKQVDERDEQITYAHRVTFGRGPTERELNRSRAFLEQQEKTYSRNGAKEAMTDFCQALMSLNEFVYIR